MIEYANESVIKLLKQYDMFSKSLNYTADLKQKNDIYDEMTKIIQNVLEITNTIYIKKFKTVENRKVYLMSEERTRLLELINLINERKAYVNNQITSNKELTGIGIDVGTIFGEDKLETYKGQVKIIERYKNNVRLESVLKEEIKQLDINIKKANNKISNNKSLNSHLEEKMINTLENAFNKLSLYELEEREKEIDLAYTELGYSLEKAKENAKIARRTNAEEIILECDNMLASITLDYERFKEKKLILNLISIYKRPVNNYQEMLNKREEINNILTNITSSELYSLVGNELNKEYATIKLETQDMATLKSLTEERNIKSNKLEDIIAENNSKELKGLLANLLENEKKYQEKLLEEKKRKEQERLEQERIQEEKRQKEIAKRQQALEEERKKEIERRTKQLLVEKKNPILNINKDNNHNVKEEVIKKKEVVPEKRITPNPKTLTPNPNIFSRKTEENTSKELTKRENNIPIIKKDNKDNRVVSKKVVEKKEDSKVFPDIPLEKKENIFPDLPEINSSNSFFDDNEFNDLSNYMEDSKKKSWF